MRPPPKIFLALWLFCCLAASSGFSFTAVYSFGDSLSDTGRSPAPPPDYYDGRFCNGPLWNEYLSAELGIPYNAANNFAVSGTTTSNLLEQISQLTPSPNLASALFTLKSGGNDFFDSVDMGANDPVWGIVVSNAVMNITNALGAIYTNGGREVIVANLPNLGLTPAFIGTPTGYSNYIDSKVALFNLLLAADLTNVAQRYPALRLYFFDDNQSFSNILRTASSYGFTVTTIGAVDDPNLTDKSFNGPGANYVYWDKVHPTTKLDKIVADSAFRYVSAELSIPRTGAQTNLAVQNLYPGLPYTIQSSSNLIAWTDYQTIKPASTNAAVVWTNQPQPRIFYRVRY
jgi:outer membrane lipase/esterase